MDNDVTLTKVFTEAVSISREVASFVEGEAIGLAYLGLSLQEQMSEWLRDEQRSGYEVMVGEQTQSSATLGEYVITTVCVTYQLIDPPPDKGERMAPSAR